MKNHDLITNDVHIMGAHLRQATGEGRFPRHIASTFLAGGGTFVKIQEFLAGSGGRGGVYIACDKHGKIYGVSLIRVRNSAVRKEKFRADAYISEHGGIDEFLVRLWSRNSIGGLYRRAKTQHRCRKKGGAAPEALIDRLDPDTGRLMNPDFDGDDTSPEPTYGHIEI